MTQALDEIKIGGLGAIALFLVGAQGIAFISLPRVAPPSLLGRGFPVSSQKGRIPAASLKGTAQSEPRSNCSNRGRQIPNLEPAAQSGHFVLELSRSNTII